MPLIVRRYLAFGSMPTDRADEVMIVISDMYQHCVFFPRYSVYSPDKSRAFASSKYFVACIGGGGGGGGGPPPPSPRGGGGEPAHPRWRACMSKACNA